MTYTDTPLKQALAKLLPEKVVLVNFEDGRGQFLVWITEDYIDVKKSIVKDTELLHLCWLVEESLTISQSNDYYDVLIQLAVEGNVRFTYHATWQSRVIALCRVKGVEIV